MEEIIKARIEGDILTSYILEILSDIKQHQEQLGEINSGGLK
jgi:hypothetical protein